MFASDWETFLALYPYQGAFEINWPSGFKPDKLETRAKEVFGLKQN